MLDKIERHHIRLIARAIKLRTSGPDPSKDLITESYDRIGAGYDEVWTTHMRDLTADLIDRLDPQPGQTAVDLTCGTGYATHLLAEKTGQRALGVDRSQGMLDAANQNYAHQCDFLRADVPEYLKTLPDNSFDIVTTCWALGYMKPYAVLKQMKRILKPAGKVAVIDNTFWTLFSVFRCVHLTFAEQPETLIQFVRPHFLFRSFYLGLYYRLLGLKPLTLYGGHKSYTTDSGAQAVKKLRATGAAAGFENMVAHQHQTQLFTRLAEIMDDKLLKDNKIKITHRYLAGIAQNKP